MWLAKQILYGDIHHEKCNIPGTLQLESSELTYTASTYHAKQQQAHLRDLEAGHVAFTDLTNLKAHPQESPDSTRKSVQMQAGDAVILIDANALSSSWLRNTAFATQITLEQHGFVNLRDQVSLLPKSTQDIAMHRIVANISLLQAATPTTVAPLMLLGDYAATSGYVSNFQTNIATVATERAIAEWEQHYDVQDAIRNAPKHLTDLIKAEPNESESVIQNILWFEQVRQQARLTYETSLKQCATNAERDFAAYWAGSIMTQVQIYSEGLQAIDDPKLQVNLGETLGQYIVTDLVPEAVKTASNHKGIQRDLNKLTERLQKAVDVGTFEAVKSAMDKLASARDVGAPSAVQMQHTKGIIHSRLASTVQTSGLAPKVFLTLILLVMLRERGVLVYATGKFAPRLLKSLKGNLDKGEYRQLEAWKDIVKAGTETKEHIEEMKKFVAANSLMP